MGTRDIETAVFFDDDRRYADLLNGYIFDGKQVVTEKQFYSQDTRGRKVTQGQPDCEKEEKYTTFSRWSKKSSFWNFIYDHCPGTSG